MVADSENCYLHNKAYGSNRRGTILELPWKISIAKRACIERSGHLPGGRRLGSNSRSLPGEVG